MSLTDREQEFYLTDYVAASDLLKSYSNMRITAVGISLALYGAVVAVPVKATLVELILMPISMMFIIIACVRMIGALNANVYARCIHLEWVEKQLESVGFFSYWNTYAPDNRSDAASSAYSVAAYVLSMGMISYVLLCAVRMLPVVGDLPPAASWMQAALHFAVPIGLSVAGLSSLAANVFYIRNNMNAATLIPRIRGKLSAQRNAVCNAAKTSVLAGHGSAEPVSEEALTIQSGN